MFVRDRQSGFIDVPPHRLELISLPWPTFLAGLEYVLEEGPRLDWFGDSRIVIAAWVSFVAFLLFLERSFFSHSPIVRLSPFRKPTFVFACVFNLVIGFGIYSSTYLIPVYLGRVRGYDSLQIGTTVFVVGCAQLLSTVHRRAPVGDGGPAARHHRGIAAVRIQPLARRSHLTAEWGFAELFWPQIVRGLAVMLCIVPSVGMALSAFQGPELRSASGLFNLMRNLGGAIGIAVVNTWLQDNARIETARIGETLGHNAQAASRSGDGTGAASRGGNAGPSAGFAARAKAFRPSVGQQALSLAFDDVFRLMAWMFVAALVMVPFAKSPPSAPASPAGCSLRRVK